VSNKGDFLAGVVIGGIVGAVAGLLLAPASGEETRTKLAEKSREYKDIAKEKAREKSQETISYTRDKIGKLKDNFSGNKEVQEALNKVDQSLSGESE